MGQQHRVTVKRSRRKAYVARKKLEAKTARPTSAKSKSKKTAAAT